MKVVFDANIFVSAAIQHRAASDTRRCEPTRRDASTPSSISFTTVGRETLRIFVAHCVVTSRDVRTTVTSWLVPRCDVAGKILRIVPHAPDEG